MYCCSYTYCSRVLFRRALRTSEGRERKTPMEDQLFNDGSNITLMT